MMHQLLRDGVLGHLLARDLLRRKRKHALQLLPEQRPDEVKEHEQDEEDPDAPVHDHPIELENAERRQQPGGHQREHGGCGEPVEYTVCAFVALDPICRCRPFVREHAICGASHRYAPRLPVPRMSRQIRWPTITTAATPTA